MALRLSPSCRTLRGRKIPHLSRPFSSSSSSSSSNGGENDNDPPPRRSPLFSDIRASLRQSPPPPLRNPSSLSRPSPQTTPFTTPKPSKIASLEEIRKNLSEFRRRSAAPSQSDGHGPSPPPSISFKDLYKSRVVGQPPSGADAEANQKLSSFEKIRENLRNFQPSVSPPGTNRSRRSETLNPYSLRVLRESLNLKPPHEGSKPPDSPIFRRELEEKKEAEPRALKTEFVKMYSYGELGEKLRTLRPTTAASGKKGWFSLEELNERLIKLREMEEKETESNIGGVSFRDLRESLVKLNKSGESNRPSIERLSILGGLGGDVPPKYMSNPPKEHLVERYFHPDNMSSEDKLKLELKRVRDEFKMSESDCGSSRVQVAQLTTKIKHLSSVLHKKDKHSRKGLLAMVQRRKKLLKYLRRTDWDSYCFVLSKLGLRDNPDYKN